MTGNHRSSLSRNIAMEGEGLFGVIRMTAVNHEARYYMLRKARYPANRAEDMRRREVEVARSTAWALARNEGAHIGFERLSIQSHHSCSGYCRLTRTVYRNSRVLLINKGETSKNFHRKTSSKPLKHFMLVIEP